MITTLFARPLVRALVGILATASLAGLYVRGGWFLGFVVLVPWLLTLEQEKTIWATLGSAWAMSVAFTVAVFAWFGIAIGNYTQVGAGTGLSVLVLCAPLFQPQFLLFALARRLVTARFGAMLGALAGIAAWVAAERFAPRLFDDTLGHALYPSRLLRQAADLGGAPGLTVLLLLVNEAVLVAVARRKDGLREAAKPLVLAALILLFLAGYGFFVLHNVSPSAGKPLRLGMVQSNIVHYEQERQEKGAYAVVRNILDTHFAMTRDAVTRERVDAVLWSETVYPTTFGHPKSEAGAALDAEILDAVRAAGVPLVFGTYDRDADGEYNAAAFVEPRNGLLGFYRKTRLFPLTEYVPTWMDGSTFRSMLPWTGTWRPGNGARVFPLRLSDGREIPVMASICLDDVDSSLAIDGARLGAEAILTMSNDSWFTDHEVGAALHQTLAAFRSIETRLPQFRVTSNGYSSIIDATGTVVVASSMGERALLTGELNVGNPPRTLMVLWGDWVGIAGAAYIVLLAAIMLRERIAPLRRAVNRKTPSPVETTVPSRILVMSTFSRIFTGALLVFGRSSLLVLGALILSHAPFLEKTLAQIRFFTAAFLIPECVAWMGMLLCTAHASFEDGVLVLVRRGRRFEILTKDIAALEPWLLPIPCMGASCRLASGQIMRFGFGIGSAADFARALGIPLGAGTKARSWALDYAEICTSVPRSRLDHPLFKVALLSLALAVPAFLLHQNIAYGSAVGEYYTFGIKALLLGLALWWASWVVGVTMGAAAVRIVIEAGTCIALLVRPKDATTVRALLQRLGHAVLYIGLPGWLMYRIFGA